MERFRRSVVGLALPLALGGVLYLTAGQSAASRSTASTHVSTDYAAGGAADPPLPVVAPQVTFDPDRSIASFDGSVVVTQTDDGLQWRDGSSGAPHHEVRTADELRAVSARGHRAATLRHSARGGEESIVTVFDAEDTGPESSLGTSYRFAGLIEPEAFSTDGTLLYVIDHAAASTPGGYRVRPLDLETGELGTMLGRDKNALIEEMNGEGRRQQWGADGTMLFTLYIRQTHHHHEDAGDAPAHAHGEPGTDGFVHVLSLDEEWAHCLDLPEQFGRGDLETTALTVSPDGEELAVIDLTAGQVAFASVDDLVVTRVVDLPDALAPNERVHLALQGRHAIVGWGSELHWLDRETLAPTGLVTELDAPLRSISAPTGGNLLVWFDDVELAPIELKAPPN